jgi:hypothetical protein
MALFERFASRHPDFLNSSVRVNLDDGSNSVNQNDALRALVAEEVGKLSKKKNYSRSLEYFAKSYISFRAEGKSNLDWVNLVCLELEYDGHQYNAIRQHLESLPSDLGPMYDQLSQRVSGVLRYCLCYDFCLIPTIGSC